MNKTASAALLAAHQGHDVMVISGIVRCLDCEVVLDASGHRPGLIAQNQER